MDQSNGNKQVKKPVCETENKRNEEFAQELENINEEVAQEMEKNMKKFVRES